jgi:uncharacterized membrane protein YdfJ with MMPL/SSD domain
MDSENMEDKLWTLANGVTGFAVLQSVALQFAAWHEKIVPVKILSPFVTSGIVFIGILTAAVYCLAVWRAYKMALSLEAKHKDIWKETTQGRILTIVLFQLIALFAWLALPHAQ